MRKCVSYVSLIKAPPGNCSTTRPLFLAVHTELSLIGMYRRVFINSTSLFWSALGQVMHFLHHWAPAAAGVLLPLKGIHAFRVDFWMKREIARSIKQSSSNDPHLYERRQHYSISSHMELAGKEEPQRKCSYWSADCYQVKLASQQYLRLFKMRWLSPSPPPPPPPLESCSGASLKIRFSLSTQSIYTFSNECQTVHMHHSRQWSSVNWRHEKEKHVCLPGKL